MKTVTCPEGAGPFLPYCSWDASMWPEEENTFMALKVSLWDLPAVAAVYLREKTHSHT